MGALLLYVYWLRPEMLREDSGISVDEDTLTALKACIALGALALSLFEGMRRLGGRPLRARTVRWGFGGLAALAVLAYFSFGDTGYHAFYHRWDIFHYYMGSKYAAELGYKSLYECTARAQSELSPAMAEEVAGRNLRNLRTDTFEPARWVLSSAPRCRAAFTDARWAAFKADVSWFREVSGKDFFNEMQTDHGYNPSPMWTVLGREVARLVGPASDTTLKVLASVDLFLFAGVFLAIGWAFGGRVLCVCLIFWGTQFAANAFFTSGGFSRQGWFFFLVLSACLLRRRRYALGGAALALTSLLRLFPVLFALPLVVVAAAHRWRTGRWAPSHQRFFAGFLVGGLLLASTTVLTLGPQAWREFAEHISHHSSAPLTNHMGLPTLLSVSGEGRMKVVPREGPDPFAKWRELRRQQLSERQPLALGLGALMLAATGVAAWRRRSLWVAMSLGAVLAASLLQLTNYYYSFLLVPCLLAAASRSVERVAFMASAASAFLVLWPKASYYYDDRYVAQTVIFLLPLGALVAALWPRRRRRPSLPVQEDVRTGAVEPPAMAAQLDKGS
ncbi:MAG: hypothetical protein JXB05_05595 [Myxococcaceae bacterium]|nr:hypothetical protein [Myxococcaceae bacterium]